MKARIGGDFEKYLVGNRQGRRQEIRVRGAFVEGSGGDWAMAGQEKDPLGQTVDLGVKRPLAATGGCV